MPRSYVIAAAILSVLLVILGVSIWRSGPGELAPTDAVIEDNVAVDEVETDSLSSWQELPDVDEEEEHDDQEVTRIIMEDFDAEFDGINVKDALSDKILLNDEVVERSTLEQQHEQSDADLSD